MGDDDDTAWSELDFTEPKKVSGEQSPPPVDRPTAPNACPFCGKQLGRGAHFHIRACEKKNHP